THEVHDVRADRCLAAESESAELPIPDAVPHEPLRVGHVLAEVTGEAVRHGMAPIRIPPPATGRCRRTRPTRPGPPAARTPGPPPFGRRPRTPRSGNRAPCGTATATR